MIMRVLAPQRPQPVPFAGTCLSLTAHAALFAVAVGSGGSERTNMPGRAAGGLGAGSTERLHWVGVRSGTGVVRSARRPSAPPPLAYVVPGRADAPATGLPVVERGPAGRAAIGPRARGSGANGLRDVAKAIDETADPLPSRALRQAGVRRTATSLHLRTAALRELLLPDPAATLLVAGVVSAAPDLARRVTRPEDFVPMPTSGLMSDVLARTGGSLTLVSSDVHLHDLPIPIVGNPPPRYPTALAHAHVGGRVIVEFRIDSTGVVDLATLQVVESTNTLFTDAVRTVLPRLHFVPAQLAEHPVGVTVRQPFVFTMRSGF